MLRLRTATSNTGPIATRSLRFAHTLHTAQLCAKGCRANHDGELCWRPRMPCSRRMPCSHRKKVRPSSCCPAASCARRCRRVVSFVALRQARPNAVTARQPHALMSHKLHLNVSCAEVRWSACPTTEATVSGARALIEWPSKSFFWHVHLAPRSSPWTTGLQSCVKKLGIQLKSTSLHHRSYFQPRLQAVCSHHCMFCDTGRNQAQR